MDLYYTIDETTPNFKAAGMGEAVQSFKCQPNPAAQRDVVTAIGLIKGGFENNLNARDAHGGGGGSGGSAGGANADTAASAAHGGGGGGSNAGSLYGVDLLLLVTLVCVAAFAHVVLAA